MSRRYPAVVLISRLQGELNRMFEEALHLGESGGESGAWEPPVDMLESEAGVTVLVELPGVDPAELTVETAGDVLSIRGGKPQPELPEKAKFHRVERARGPFHRILRIQQPVNTHQGRARLADGLLRIDFPKIVSTRSVARRLDVETPQED